MLKKIVLALLAVSLSTPAVANSRISMETAANYAREATGYADPGFRPAVHVVKENDLPALLNKCPMKDEYGEPITVNPASVLAFYDDCSKTDIYINENYWKIEGTVIVGGGLKIDPQYIDSILVHEMVHFYQDHNNFANIEKMICPASSEPEAYEVQRDYLEETGSIVHIGRMFIDMAADCEPND